MYSTSLSHTRIQSDGFTVGAMATISSKTIQPDSVDQVARKAEPALRILVGALCAKSLRQILALFPAGRRSTIKWHVNDSNPHNKVKISFEVKIERSLTTGARREVERYLQLMTALMQHLINEQLLGKEVNDAGLLGELIQLIGEPYCPLTGHNRPHRDLSPHLVAAIGAAALMGAAVYPRPQKLATVDQPHIHADMPTHISAGAMPTIMTPRTYEYLADIEEDPSSIRPQYHRHLESEPETFPSLSEKRF